MSIGAATSITAGATGNGATTSFSFSFRIQDYGAVTAEEQVEVTLVSTAGTGTVKTLTTHYTVSVNGDQDSSPGGSITFLTAPASGEKVYIRRNPSLLQSTELQNQGAFNAAEVETQFDQGQMGIQALNELLSRAFILPVGEAGAATVTTRAANRANLSVVTDADGNITFGASTGTTASAAMVPVIQASTLTDALELITDEWITYSATRLSLGSAASAATSFPDAGLDLATSQPTFYASNIRMATPGDGVDLYVLGCNGTRASPTIRSGAYAHMAIYNWSLGNGGTPVPPSPPYSGITYYGRSAQERFCQTETPTDTARGGAIVWGATKNGALTPWDDMWLSQAGNLILAPDLVEDNTALPWDSSAATTVNAFNPTGADWSNFHGDATLTILCRDLANAGAIAFLNNTSRTNGHVVKYEQSSNELWGYRRVAGSDSTLFRLGFASGFCDFGFQGTTAPALRAQGIANQTYRIEARGGDGSTHPYIFVSGASNADLRLGAAGTGVVKIDGFQLYVNVGANAGQAVLIESSEAGATSGPNLNLYRSSASPAANDILATVAWDGKDSGGNSTTYARIQATIEDPTDASEDGRLKFAVVTAGTLANELQLDGAALSPAADGGLTLGAASLGFGGLLFASGAAINWNGGDVTITHSSNALAFAGASGGYSFDAPVTVTSTAASTATSVVSTDAGASQGPTLELYRDSASPANSDNLGAVEFYGRDSAANKQLFGRISVSILDVTSGSEDSGLSFDTPVAGTTGTRLIIAGGLYHSSATGGDKGANTINFGAVYDDNVLLSDYVLDMACGDFAKGETYSERVQAVAAEFDPAMFEPGNYEAFWREHRRLPNMPDLNDAIDGIVKEYSLGAMIQKLWEVCEVQAVHIAKLRARIEALEA